MPILKCIKNIHIFINKMLFPLDNMAWLVYHFATLPKRDFCSIRTLNLLLKAPVCFFVK